LDIQQVEPDTGYTAFHLACTGGHLSVVQQLMAKYGIETCRQLLTKNDGKSGLILAAGAGKIEIVQTILSTYKKNEIR
jgi:ankyrin repeat protein